MERETGLELVIPSSHLINGVNNLARTVTDNFASHIEEYQKL